MNYNDTYFNICNTGLIRSLSISAKPLPASDHHIKRHLIQWCVCTSQLCVPRRGVCVAGPTLCFPTHSWVSADKRTDWGRAAALLHHSCLWVLGLLHFLNPNYLSFLVFYSWHSYLWFNLYKNSFMLLRRCNLKPLLIIELIKFWHCHDNLKVWL